MGTDHDVVRLPPLADLQKELASVAGQLAGHCLAIDLAIARDDFDVVCDSTEAAKELCQRMAVLYRHLLARRTTSTRISESSSL